MKYFTRRSARNFTLAVMIAGRVVADPATGQLADRTLTLLQLDAVNVSDPASSLGVHFSGSRVISILDAAISTYYYQNGGNVNYYSVRPFIPNIQVGPVEQAVREHGGTVGPAAGSQVQIPVAGGGTVGAGIGFSGDTHASASLAAGTLRCSVAYGLGGPGVEFTPAAPYSGFGAQGGATAQAEIADYLTTSVDTTLTISGVWEGTLDASVPGSWPGVGASSPTVFATGPSTASVIAHMEISVWSAPQTTFHPGGGEEGGGGRFVTSRARLGGVSFDQQVSFGQSTNISQPFSFTVDVPAGDFYFYAQQNNNAGVFSDPTQGRGGAVYVNAVGSANFDHTLQFDMTPAAGSGAVITSASRQFLTAEPLLATPHFDGAGGLVLTWKVMAGHTYQVRYKDTLASAWQNLGSSSTAAIDGMSSTTDATPPSAGRYYQIVVAN